jgi:hypothetical protein
MNRDRHAIMRKVRPALALPLAACGAECSGFQAPRRPRPRRVEKPYIGRVGKDENSLRAGRRSVL